METTAHRISVMTQTTDLSAGTSVKRAARLNAAAAPVIGVVIPTASPILSMLISRMTNRGSVHKIPPCTLNRRRTPTETLRSRSAIPVRPRG